MAIDGFEWAFNPRMSFSDQWSNWGEFLGNNRKPYRIKKKPEEWVPVAEALSKSNDGLLQCSEWLRKHGYYPLVRSLIKHPLLFDHIPQEVRGSGSRRPLIGIRHNGEIKPISAS